MKISLDNVIAESHANALSRNYRTAWPTASRDDIASYVATEMVKFVRAHNARNVADSVDAWYDYTLSTLRSA